jgi:tetratricopeptide (TPR) repeat protein
MMRKVPLLSGVLALAVLALAVPYTWAAARVLPDQKLVAALEDGREEKSYAAALANYQHALAVVADSQLQFDLALIATSAARQDQLEWAQAEQALYASLRARPLDPVSWARLGYVLDAQGPEKAAAAREAIIKSMALGRFMPGFMQWRLILALTRWPDFTPDQQAIVAEQVELLWQKKRSNLIRLARIPALAPTLEQILTTYQPEDVETFLRQRRPLRHNQK